MNLGLLATLSSNLRRSQYTLEDKDTNMSTLEDNDTNIQEETEVRILVQMRLENSSLQFFFSLFICNKVSFNNTSRKN